MNATALNRADLSGPQQPYPLGPGRARTVVVARRQQLGAQLAGLERDWKRLHRLAQPQNPFLSWEWQRAWIAAHPDGAQPLVVAETFADGTLAGLLALQRVRRRGLAHLEFLGQSAGGDDLDCLLHPSAPAGVAGRLLDVALGLRPWSLLRLEAARPDGALAAAVADVAARGGPAATEDGEWLPYLPLPEHFDQLLASHSANFRAEIRRRRRGFAKQEPQARVECAAAPGAVAAGLDHLFRLHNLRRTQKQGRGLFESARLCSFHRQAAAAPGARLYLLRTPSAVIAALYGFAAGDRFLYFQSGFDPAWTAASPGTVLLSAVIEDCMARGLRQFEFLRGEESYKARWTSVRRRNCRLLLAGSGAGQGYLRLRAWAHRLRCPTAEAACS